MLIALSQPGPGTVKKEWVASMADKAIVFACANPVPEIWPQAAHEAGAKVVATGRGDFPNQVNNSLCFPAIFRGVLDVRARTITDSMALAAAHELGDRMRAGVVLGGIGPTRGADSIVSHTLLLVPAAALLERVRRPLARGLHDAIDLVKPYADPAVDIFFRLLPGDLEESYSAVPEAGPPIVVLHPGAGDPRRHWPTEGFAAVGDALAAAGARIVVIGGRPEERPLVDAVVDGMKAPALNLAGRISLRGLAGLLARCAVVVGNDSGPLHLAHAVGARTVGVYWCGNVITAGPLTRGRHRLAISWRLNCPVCGVDTTRTPCSHHVSFVADVPVDEVLEPALELYQDALHGG